MERIFASTGPFEAEQLYAHICDVVGLTFSAIAPAIASRIFCFREAFAMVPSIRSGAVVSTTLAS